MQWRTLREILERGGGGIFNMHAFGVRLRYANLSNIIVSATVPKYEFKLSKYEFKLSKYAFKLSKYEFKLSRQWRTLREILGGGGAKFSTFMPSVSV